jgi:DNA-binding CsgD family transcriptional regulator
MPDDMPLRDSLALYLYAAVLDGQSLGGVIDAIRRAVGADFAWVSRIPFARDRPSGVERFDQSGLDPSAVGDYVGHWVREDPWLLASQGLAPGAHNYESLVPQHALLKSAFWNDFAGRQSVPVHHVMAAGVAMPGQVTGMLAVQRPARAGPFQEAQERLLQGLYPHISRAMLAEAQLARAGLQAAAAGAGLDALRQGVAVIAPGGQMVHANATLIEQAGQADGLRLTAQGPACDDAAAQALLTRGIQAALAVTMHRGNLPEAGAIFVPRRSGGAWIVQVLTLTASATGLFAGFIGALVLVADQRRPALPRASTLRAQLGLTPAEADLSLALAAGVTMADHARTRRVGIETLRTHLASIRRKTGCRRQVELVACVLSLRD